MSRVVNTFLPYQLPTLGTPYSKYSYAVKFSYHLYLR